MPSAQIASPLAVDPSQHGLRLITGQDFYNSLNATLASKQHERPTTPVRHIQENDYAVPAPPPPSPVSFRNDPWAMPNRR
ncbi:hypothetical protein S7711_03984 [Stachybotrys chartarum IBT 7711]|uniref:Uncharacterized protein n=1 Tax=Stachybotrys chartarum (strain CBS 109288 / IBT 7711) TaxID=1280523 RepID=A0A084AXD7_STACB|nr:hypothetical protein S7711_03984 [Stachybotrys chartarum IBT 7711]KFA46581.1 hypothetical protein S40293_09237 [Stachybotrys chartarum IBT 40293]KFA77605.1 hypothetical protein S40288_08408 [Stachybotrys chartarum IBT 40288]